MLCYIVIRIISTITSCQIIIHNNNNNINNNNFIKYINYYSTGSSLVIFFLVPLLTARYLTAKLTLPFEHITYMAFVLIMAKLKSM